MKSVVLSIAFSSILSMKLMADEASRLSLALTAVHENQTELAIELLEKAFETSSSQEELYRIANILTEILPVNHSALEGHLLYLIQFLPHHLDYGRWLFRLGEVFEYREDFVRAEDWILRAQAHGVSVSTERMATLKWNRGNQRGALESFLSVATKSEDSPKLEELISSISRIWLELGRLEPSLWRKIQDSPHRKRIFEQVYRQFSEQLEAANPSIILSQIFEVDSYYQEYLIRMSRFQDFPEDPCFLFRQQLVRASSQVPIPRILDCAEGVEDLDSLLPYLEAHQVRGDESFIWAQAEVLQREGKALEAFKLALTAVGNNHPDFLKFVLSLFLKLSESERQESIESSPRDPWMFWMQQRSIPVVLDYLRAQDPELWQYFEDPAAPSTE